MLFTVGIRIRWFNILVVLFAAVITFILSIYFIDKDMFVNIFGSSFFLRIDRLLDWSSKAGYQLKNGITAIGSAGFLGHGFNKTPLYYPEPQTDFIFATFSSNFGFLGSCILIFIFLLLNIRLIKIAEDSKNNINKYVVFGALGMLIYQQLQNIGMTFGLMPITRITLPFVSYGGSSLLSYMIIIGLILNIHNENKKNIH